MALIISSFEKFGEKFPEAVADPNDARAAALKTYFAHGGVVNVLKEKEGAWPKLLYPDAARLNRQLKEINTLKDRFQSKRGEWRRQLAKAKTYELRHKITRFSNPLYWKHVAKTMSDADYKADAESVKLPVHLVDDPRWKPMVRMFIDDIEYRKQLVETVENSIVYGNDRKVARYANELQEFRAGVSEGKVLEIEKKIGEIEGQIKTINSMILWARK
ncbi:MAG: hypothetical protein V1676_05345 [Candidatus Diapherotrites archaeon]